MDRAQDHSVPVLVHYTNNKGRHQHIYVLDVLSARAVRTARRARRGGTRVYIYVLVGRSPTPVWSLPLLCCTADADATAVTSTSSVPALVLMLMLLTEHV